MNASLREHRPPKTIHPAANRDSYRTCAGYSSPPYPSSQTTFIKAHLGCLGHDLGRLGELLDQLPKVYAEIGAVTCELGRQPRTALRFFVKYQNHILFVKDSYTVSEYHISFRLLATDDEHFDPIRKYHGIWKLSGFALPDDVLKKSTMKTR